MKVHHAQASSSARLMDNSERFIARGLKSRLMSALILFRAVDSLFVLISETCALFDPRKYFCCVRCPDCPVHVDKFCGCCPYCCELPHVLPLILNSLQVSLAMAYSTDRAALLELYRLTSGNTWRVDHKWGADDQLSAWSGVEVDHGRVVQLALIQNGLQGILIIFLFALSLPCHTLYRSETELRSALPAGSL